VKLSFRTEIEIHRSSETNVVFDDDRGFIDISGRGSSYHYKNFYCFDNVSEVMEEEPLSFGANVEIQGIEEYKEFLEEETKRLALEESKNPQVEYRTTKEFFFEKEFTVQFSIPNIENLNPLLDEVCNIRTSSNENIEVVVDYYEFHGYTKPETMKETPEYWEEIWKNPMFQEYREQVSKEFPKMYNNKERTSFFKFMDLEPWTLCGKKGLPKREFTPFKKDVKRPLIGQKCQWRILNEIPPYNPIIKEEKGYDNNPATFNPFAGLKLS